MQKLFSFLILLAYVPGVASASSLAEFNALPQTPPAWWEADGADGFYGATETGRTFTQETIDTDASVRMQKFSYAEQSFYVTDRGVIFADSSLAALSVYFARV